MQLTIAPFEGVDGPELYQLADDLTQHHYKIRISKPLTIPSYAYNPERDQYMADKLFRPLRQFEQHGERVLGVINQDLYQYILKCVYGLADLPGYVAMMSLYRLRQTRHEHTLRQRMLKLALHELGHTHGLEHCKQLSCVMCFSPNLQRLDLSGTQFCSHCQEQLEHHLEAEIPCKNSC